MTAIAICRDDVSFGIAFHAARIEGARLFEWHGKLYNTDLAPEKKEPPKVIIGWRTHD